MKPLLLIGCGGHARSVIDVVERLAEWQIVGLLGLPQQIGQTVLGYPVIGSDEDLAPLRSRYEFAFLSIGQIQSPSSRMKLAGDLNHYSYTCPSIISPAAVVSKHSVIGEGCFVGHLAIVNAGATVGRHCILNSASLVEHDVSIGDHCHISTGVILNGGVAVGAGSFVGSGSMLREGLELPEGTVVSAGKRVMGWPPL